MCYSELPMRPVTPYAEVVAHTDSSGSVIPGPGPFFTLPVLPGSCLSPQAGVVLPKAPLFGG